MQPGFQSSKFDFVFLIKYESYYKTTGQTGISICFLTVFSSRLGATCWGLIFADDNTRNSKLFTCTCNMFLNMGFLISYYFSNFHLKIHSCPVLAPTSYIFKNRWMIFLSVKSKVLLIWGLGSSTCRIKSLYLQHKITSQASLKLIFDTLWIGEYVPDCVPRG